jgi:hypothetical protein
MKEVGLSIAGFARVHIREDGSLVGDSGWIKNRFTDYGIDEGLGRVLGSAANSVRVDYAAIGTGGAPATGDTALSGELQHTTNNRDQTTKTVVTTADATAVTVRHYGTFSSSLLTETDAIQNIGLFASSLTAGGTVITGTNYTVSTIQTNQDLEYTYEWQISTS